MTYLERLLQINIAAMAALGTLLLGMGERNATLPLMMLFVAVTSVWLTDVTGWFRLNRTVANLAAVVAMLIALRDLFPLSAGIPILAIANLLIYLQIVLLFQKKNTRAYWWLAVLSLLQVVVAAAFNQGVFFGIMLVVYLLVALSALCLFFLLREAQRFGAAVATSTLGAPAPEARWPLGAQSPIFSGGSAGERRAGVGGELFVRLLLVAGGTLLLTAIVFFVIPRLGRTAFRGSMMVPQHVVGYSGEVELGELGEIIESSDELMRINFFDATTGRAYEVHGDLYLHGTVLTEYDQGKWSFHRLRPHYGRFRGFRERREGFLNRLRPWSNKGLVRQRITIEPLEQAEVFYVRPVFTREEQLELELDPWHERLFRPGDRMRSRFACELLTTAFEEGIQVPWVPCHDSNIPSESMLEALRQLPRDEEGNVTVPKLVALAKEWIKESGLPEEDIVGRARYLESKLRDSGRFTYSLEGQSRNLDLDPIEDFITEHPVGHCEYFATALALMLRSQGIPARLVVGYRCDEWNELGHFYQVRQLHAHTWVEAFLSAREVPKEVYQGRWQWHGAVGGWLRLEPTSPQTEAPTSESRFLLGPVADFADWLEHLWDNYVMEMDRSRQKSAIYEPLSIWAQEMARQMRDPGWWQGLGKGLIRMFDFRQGNVDRWFSWRGGLTAMGIALLMVFSYRACRWVGRRVRAILDARAASRRRRHLSDIEFYRRFRLLLARDGHVRSPSQTHREFALATGQRLAQVHGSPQLASQLGLIVDAFYQVRFGHQPLDNPQTETVEQALGQLEALVGDDAKDTKKRNSP